MPVKPVFYHGWGFDSSIWDSLADGFPDCAFSERGYFGAAPDPLPDGDFIAVTHSFGTMRLLSALPASCLGIVAIGGFDRFSACAGFPGVPSRLIERMVARFGDAPDEVLSEFRQRCGCDAHFGGINPALLVEDLVSLRDGDCRELAAQSGLPILSLQGGRDPILPEALREAVFAKAEFCERATVESGGHLLPVQQSAPCARAISAFMERLS